MVSDRFLFELLFNLVWLSASCFRAFYLMHCFSASVLQAVISVSSPTLSAWNVQCRGMKLTPRELDHLRLSQVWSGKNCNRRILRNKTVTGSLGGKMMYKVTNMYKNVFRASNDAEIRGFVHLFVAQAGQLAQRRLARGLRLNHPEVRLRLRIWFLVFRSVGILYVTTRVYLCSYC